MNKTFALSNIKVCLGSKPLNLSCCKVSGRIKPKWTLLFLQICQKKSMLVISHEIPRWPKWIGRLSEGANWHPQGAWRPLRCYCITPLRNNDLNQSEIIIIFAIYNYNQGKGNNDPSQLEFHQTVATGLLEKMSVFTRLSKESKEFEQNNYRVKVKGFPILMTVECHLNWKTLTKRP